MNSVFAKDIKPIDRADAELYERELPAQVRQAIALNRVNKCYMSPKHQEFILPFMTYDEHSSRLPY